MPSVVDVAEYILREFGEMSVWKLQKITYYSQAWHLVWNEEPLFNEPIQAWANGPVIPSLYACHRGEFIVNTVNGNPENLNEAEIGTIKKVFNHYGQQTAAYLSQLTHLEQPWIVAREGVPDGVRSTNQITQESMHEYYSFL